MLTKYGNECEKDQKGAYRWRSITEKADKAESKHDVDSDCITIES